MFEFFFCQIPLHTIQTKLAIEITQRCSQRQNLAYIKLSGEMQSHTRGVYSIEVIWDKVFKNGPRKICGRQPLRIRSDMVC